MNRDQRKKLETAAFVAAVKVGEADRVLERVYQIAEVLQDMPERGKAAQRARRAGRRICNLIDQVDEALGLDGE